MKRRAASTHREVSIPKGPIAKVRKRDGSIVNFDLTRITNAVQKAMIATGEGTKQDAEFIARKVYSELKRIAKVVKNLVPSVEAIQDIVEKELIFEEFAVTAKAYILYREERARLREQFGIVPEHVRKLTAESKKYFK